MACVAYDDDGSLMNCYTINTIVPLLNVVEGRIIASEHLNGIEGRDENTVDMLPIPLYTNGILTHYFCSRHGHNNTVRNQIATMAAEFLNGKTWVSDTYFYLEDSPNIDFIKTHFCFVLGDETAVLSYLGLSKEIV